MTAQRAVDVLLFDLGGVLVDFTGFEDLDSLLEERIPTESIQKRWIRSDAIREFESGRITAKIFARIFVTEWRLSLTPGEFLHRFSGWSRGLYPGTARLLQRLGKTHRTACLSNSNEIHAPAQRRWLDGLIESFFFSYEAGIAKPDSSIFELTIGSLGVPAGRIAYFDDTLINVKAASAVGMNAFHVTGPEDLETTLRRLGVIAD